MGDVLVGSGERKCTACMNCRRLKVKCIHSDPNDESSPCLRCLKRKKECVFFPGKRKYAPPLDQAPPKYEAFEQFHPQSPGPLAGPQAYRVYQLESIPRFQFTTAKVNSIRNKLTSSWQDITEGEQLQTLSIEAARRYPAVTIPANNLIAQGLLTRDEALKRIEIYKREMYPVMPVVELPDVGLDEFIETMPILFHAVMDVTAHLAGGPDPWTEEERDHVFLVHNIIYESIVYEVYIIGTKNIELIQALLVIQNWFSDPHFHHRKKVHLLFASLIALACDCGLGVDRPCSSTPEKGRTYLDQIIQPHLIDENLTPECAKCWIGIYQFASHHMSSFVSRINLEWSTYLDSCVGVVQGLGPSVHILEVLAQYSRLFERATRELMRRNNQPTALDVDDPAVQYLVQHIDDEVDTLRAANKNPGLVENLAYYSLKAYLHQLVLYCPYSDKIGRASFTVYSLNIERSELGQFAVKSFVSCYQNALKCIETVLQFSPRELLCLTIPAMSNIFFCSAIVVKCRMLCMFNRNYHDACPVPDATMDTVADLTTFFDAVVAHHSAAKMLSTMSFVIKVILCRTDAVIYSVMQERDRANLDIQRYPAQHTPQAQAQQHTTERFSHASAAIAAQGTAGQLAAISQFAPGAGAGTSGAAPGAPTTPTTGQGLGGPTTPGLANPEITVAPPGSATASAPSVPSGVTPGAHGVEVPSGVPPQNGMMDNLAPMDINQGRRLSETMSMTELWDFADQYLWKDYFPASDGNGPSFDF